MAEPRLVAECVAAMKGGVAIPVTVKSRIGIDDRDSYEELVDFVAAHRRGRLRRPHRPRPQGLAPGPEPQGEPRDTAAAL